jgi:hypothetical protein
MQTASGFWTLLFGWVCVVPAALPQQANAVTGGGAQAGSTDGILSELEREWQRTVDALDQLRGIEKGLVTGPRPEPGYMRPHSEPAHWTLDEAGLQLVELSKSIRDLEQELQALRSRPPERPAPPATETAQSLGAPRPSPEAPSAQASAGSNAAPTPTSATAGLSSALRTRQSEATRLRSQGLKSAPQAPLQLPESITPASARAAYLSGDYQSALAQFERLPDSPAVLHWRARSLERLGRLSEALERFDALAKDPAAGAYASRAEQDAGFLRWKQALDTATPSPEKAP